MVKFDHMTILVVDVITLILVFILCQPTLVIGVVVTTVCHIFFGILSIPSRTFAGSDIDRPVVIQLHFGCFGRWRCFDGVVVLGW